MKDKLEMGLSLEVVFMRYPEFFKKGDTIGFAAPSFGCATEPYRSAFDNALKTFRKMGYGICLDRTVIKATGSASALHRKPAEEN